MVRLFDILELGEPLHILDVGAANITEAPIYKSLLDQKIGELHAFEGDPRQIEGLRAAYGDQVNIHNLFLFDGTEQDLHVATASTGMTSLLKPDQQALAFFNGFQDFGRIHSVERVSTTRLNDVADVPPIDFAKLDIQGAELTVLKNGMEKLRDCLAIQIEVSYVRLYKNQPPFGEVDVWMRAQGYEPHMFLGVKKWTIAPSVFHDDFKRPGNQLLESDVVYVRSPFKLRMLSNLQLAKFAALSHHCFGSPDLAVHILRELIRRGELEESALEQYAKFVRHKVFQV